MKLFYLSGGTRRQIKTLHWFLKMFVRKNPAPWMSLIIFLTACSSVPKPDIEWKFFEEHGYCLDEQQAKELIEWLRSK